MKQINPLDTLKILGRSESLFKKILDPPTKHFESRIFGEATGLACSIASFKRCANILEATYTNK